MQKYYEPKINALIQELNYLQVENSRLRGMTNKTSNDLLNELKE